MKWHKANFQKLEYICVELKLLENHLDGTLEH